MVDSVPNRNHIENIGPKQEHVQDIFFSGSRIVQCGFHFWHPEPGGKGGPEKPPVVFFKLAIQESVEFFILILTRGDVPNWEIKASKKVEVG